MIATKKKNGGKNPELSGQNKKQTNKMTATRKIRYTFKKLAIELELFCVYALF